MIHPTAIIDPKANLDSSVTVGPYAVIDGDVTLGPGCSVGPHAYITGVTTAGARNKFHGSSVIGGTPQDLKYKGEKTGLRIGNDNVFREFVTVNCSTAPGDETAIGSNNLLMACSHVAHNCQLGNHIIMGNGTLLGGHVHVEDRAIISGTCLVHQFVRIGTLAMMRGGAAISKDLPPFTVARLENGICGLNIVGLRRAGFSSEDRLELKRLYRALFLDKLNLSAAVAQARKTFTKPAAVAVLDFVSASKRGVCTHPDHGSYEEDEE